MSFTRKRGRPVLARPAKDNGTPELQEKRSAGLTFEAADRCLQLGVINEEQHHAARRLSWLFRLRHGRSWLTAISLDDCNAAPVHEEDEIWSAKREKEYMAAIASFACVAMRKAVFDICIYDRRPTRADISNLRDGLDSLVKFWKL